MKLLAKNKHIWFLSIIIVCFVVLRFPSLIEPNWYGDEGIYQVIGHAISEGKLLYQDVWDNKPPLLYLIYAIGQGNLFFAKLLSLIVGIFSVVAFYFLSRKLFKQNKSIYASTLLFAVLFGAPILEGNIANAENFMMLPTLVAAIFVIKYSEEKTKNSLLIAGVLLSLSLILKIVAIFDFLAFATFILLVNKNFIKSKSALYLTLSFISLLVISFVFFLFKSIPFEFFDSVFLKNLSYVGEENSFLFPMGILILKTLLLGFGIFFIAKYKKLFSSQLLFIYIWGLFGVYNAFFSDRPYTHYLLVLLPAFCLIFADVFARTKKITISVVSLIVIGLIGYFHFRIYTKNIDYYSNFISYMTERKSITDYQSFFDKNTPRDYSIAEFIELNVDTDESIYLWSDSAQIYALAGKTPITKYVVSYHVNFYDQNGESTKIEIIARRPDYIIQAAAGNFLDDLISSYQLKYIIDGAKIYERQN
jgi:hypothetical protein